ncbi:MAG: MFS transporter [Bifidobacteriaceae bacterium]|jgi:MFS family permease|nr:MFS transporter [Bifidobacteriaceae bacterium]
MATTLPASPTSSTQPTSAKRSLKTVAPAVPLIPPADILETPPDLESAVRQTLHHAVSPPPNRPDAPPDGHPEAGIGLAIAYVAAYLTMYVALMTPVMSTLAVKVGSLTTDSGKVVALSLVTGVGAFFAFVANPIAGALSDRTCSKMGMRRPWLFGGVLGGAIGLTMIGLATHVWMVVLGWAIAQACFNATQAALQAILPDQIPSRMRAKVSGWLGVGQNVAPLIGIALAFWFADSGLPISLMIIVPAALGVTGVFILAFILKDRMLRPEEVSRFKLSSFIKGFWVSPKRFPDFAWAWLGRFMIFFGFASYNNYQVYFLQDRFGYTDAQALNWQLKLMVIQAIALTAAAAVGGQLSDRSGRRKIFVVIAAVLAGLGLAVFALAADPSVLYYGAGLWGLGLGAYLAVDIALVTDVLPNARTEAAKNLGVFNIANALPQSLAPAVAPVFLAVGATATMPANYTSLFLMATVFALVGAATTMFIRGAK